MEYTNRLDKFAAQHRVIFALFFIPVMIGVVGLMGIGAAVEEWKMKRKGYFWDSCYGGYRNPDTGDHIKGWI